MTINLGLHSFIGRTRGEACEQAIEHIMAQLQQGARVVGVSVSYPPTNSDSCVIVSVTTESSRLRNTTADPDNVPATRTYSFNARYILERPHDDEPVIPGRDQYLRQPPSW